MTATVMERPRLGPRELSGAFAFATDWLGVFVDEINALNVYPVPDGDTGTNMHLTLQSVRRQLGAEDPERMAGFAHALAYGSLLGARGNSGVILSQILKGFAEVCKASETLGAEELVRALQAASESAYAAVMKPVEGTILTVARAAAEGAAASAARAPLQLLQDAHAAAAEALDRTPEMLPILKQAGVVDAGGLGLLRLLDGVIAFFEERELPPPPEVTKRAQQQFGEEEFGYCTEFLLENVRVPASEIQELVRPYGDSLLVVGAEGFVKGHIHTEEPERLLAEVARYGDMVRSKVEDMSEQHSEILAAVDPDEAEPPRSGLVAVSDGYGVTKAFRALGARVVGGGQTNNPSVQDIADAVRSVGAPDVIVMPNNKNIVMAAERVAELVTDKRVHVLPTRTLGAGLAAAVLFHEGAEVDELFEQMHTAAEHAATLEVTRASRSATIDGVAVEEGDFIGMVDNRLAVSADTAEACLLALLEGVAADPDRGPFEVAVLFHAASVDAAQAEALLPRIDELMDGLEVDLHPGAPELYPYLMTLE